MNIYQLNDCEWWLAESLEEAKQALRDTYGADFSSDLIDDDARKLTDEELDRLNFCDEGALYKQAGDVEMWECPVCGCPPRLDSHWRWDGEKWEHDHSDKEIGVTGWIAAENTMKRSFREQLTREKADGKARLFATTEA